MSRNRILVVGIAVLLLGGLWLIQWKSRPPSAGAVAGERQSTGAPSAAVARLVPWTEILAPGNADRSFIAPNGASPLAAWAAGVEVSLPLSGGDQVRGRVNLVVHEPDGTIRVGGELLDRKGTFSVTANGRLLSGRVLLTQAQVGYEVITEPGGRLVVQRRALNDIFCFGLPALAETTPAAVPAEVQAAPPLLSSRPSATAVLYLDFDGATVIDPDWNGGNPIVAAPSTLGSSEITEVWQRVKEDYAAFDIDVTTDPSRYANAPVGRRMRCIITPTASWFGPVGGVAYLNSFRQGGADFTTTVPCWIFNSTLKGIAEAISHEAGHTFGLHHDGRTSPPEEYYAGQGTGDLGWAPIMGVGYNQPLVQWSKGEYANANNHEDDVAIIASAENGFGFVADDHNGTRLSPTTEVTATGLISPGGEVDYFVMDIPAKGVVVTATPTGPSPNADLLLELQDGNGVLLATSNPDSSLAASVQSLLSAGTYYIKVQGTGRGSPLGDGYSAYGSFGNYAVTVALSDPPRIQTAPVSQSALPGATVTFSVTATGSGLGYFWRRNGVNLVDDAHLSGATTSTLTISNVSKFDVGEYTVLVSSGGGAIISAPAVLALADVPEFILRPRTQITTFGQSVQFDARAVSSETVNYAWSHNGAIIPGATGSRLTIASASASDRGWYEVWAINSIGTTRSRFRLEAVAPNSTVLAWGSENTRGQLSVPVGTGNIVAVDQGWEHSVALRADGTVLAWGSSDGQTTIPAGLKNVVAISAGSYHTLALTSDGKVVAWGRFFSEEIIVPPNLTDVIAISAGARHSVALKADGSIVVWGYGNAAVPAPGNLTDAVDIAAGFDHTLALTAYGTVAGWGGNFNGELNFPAGLANVTAIATSSTLSLARKTDGTVASWGSAATPFSEYNVPANLNAVAISTSGTHSLAMKPDGTLIAWGRDASSSSVLPIPPEAVNVTAFSARWNYLALVPVVGVSIVNQPVGGTVDPGTTVELNVTAGGTPRFGYLWKRNGIALVDGGNISGAATAKLIITNAQPTDSGSYTVLVTNTGGDVTSLPAILNVAPPPVISNRPLSRLASVGDSLSFSVTATGAGPLTYQWKHDGRVVTSATGPTIALPSATVADSGWYQVTVLSANGNRSTSVFHLTVSPRPIAGPLSVVAWGYNFSGQTSVPAGLNNVVALSAGWSHSLALKADGTVVAWGSNANVPVTVPAGLSEVVAISAGSDLSVALKADGRLVAWGSANATNGITGIAALRDIVAIGGGTLKGDGTVVRFDGTPGPVTGIAKVSSGMGGSFGITLDGTVVSLFGDREVPANPANVTRVSAGNSQYIALKADGTVTTWGALALTPPAGLTGVVNVAAGGSFAYALKADGRIAAMGDDFNAVVSDAAALENVFLMAAGQSHGVALVAPTAVTLAAPLGNAAVTAGQTATLRVTVNGTPPFSYQWSRNGVNIPGANAAIYAIPGAQESDGGSYAVAVSNALGTVTSGAATLTVTGPPTAPIIRSQSQSLAVMAGTAQSISVTAAGSVPLTYQWYAGQPGDLTTPIAGGNGPALDPGTIAAIQTVWLRIGNPGGTTDSAGILVMPWQARDAGSGTTHLTGASYANGRYYVMRAGGGAYSTDGATWTSFSAPAFVAGIQTRVAYGNGIYVAGGGSVDQVLYTSDDGATWTSRASAQNAIVARAIFDGTKFVAVGSKGQISSSADGRTWILRESSSTTELVSVVYGGGQYLAAGLLGRVVASANGTSWTYPNPLTFQPYQGVAYGQGRFVGFAGPAGFINHYTIVRSENGTTWTQSTPPLLNGSDPPVGGGSDIVYGGGLFVIAAGKSIFMSEDGINWFATGNFFPNQTIQRNSLAYGNGRFIAAGENGTLLQSLPIARAARISRLTPSHWVSAGQAAQLSVVAEGPGLSYQWYRGTNGNTSDPIAGASGASYQTSAITQLQSYWVRVSNDTGAVDSATISVGVAAAPLPVITTAPLTQTAYLGGSITLAVAASSATTLSYQWQRNGVDIPGATGSTFTIGNAQAGDAGSYSVFVTNDAGIVISVPAVLTVAAPVAPQITRQPATQAAAVGQAVTFRVSATGTPGPDYQWRKGGVAIAGANAAMFSIAMVHAEDAGDYTVTVSNFAGSVVSNVATLAIAPAGTSATHELTNPGYVPGGTITINNTFIHTGATTLAWHVLLPAGWTFASDSGDTGSTKPTSGQADLLEWQWNSAPPSSVSFSYTLNVPANQAGTAEIVALAEWLSGSLLQMVAKPDPLVVPPARHAADTNGNDKIDVSELSRVIALYNTRFTTPDGKIRTGAYSIATGTTADGFAPDLARDPSATATLERYHSADYNHNGRIDVAELSRVITLYNTRFTTPDGKIRTGFYKLAPGTQPDGFAPDPTREP